MANSLAGLIASDRASPLSVRHLEGLLDLVSCDERLLAILHETGTVMVANELDECWDLRFPIVGKAFEVLESRVHAVGFPCSSSPNCSSLPRRARRPRRQRRTLSIHVLKALGLLHLRPAVAGHGIPWVGDTSPHAITEISEGKFGSSETSFQEEQKTCPRCPGMPGALV